MLAFPTDAASIKVVLPPKLADRRRDCAEAGLDDVGPTMPRRSVERAAAVVVLVVDDALGRLLNVRLHLRRRAPLHHVEQALALLFQD